MVGLTSDSLKQKGWKSIQQNRIYLFLLLDVKRLWWLKVVEFPFKLEEYMLPFGMRKFWKKLNCTTPKTLCSCFMWRWHLEMQTWFNRSDHTTFRLNVVAQGLWCWQWRFESSDFDVSLVFWQKCKCGLDKFQFFDFRLVFCHSFLIIMSSEHFVSIFFVYSYHGCRCRCHLSQDKCDTCCNFSQPIKNAINYQHEFSLLMLVIMPC